MDFVTVRGYTIVTMGIITIITTATSMHAMGEECQCITYGAKTILQEVAPDRRKSPVTLTVLFNGKT